MRRAELMLVSMRATVLIWTIGSKDVKSSRESHRRSRQIPRSARNLQRHRVRTECPGHAAQDVGAAVRDRSVAVDWFAAARREARNRQAARPGDGFTTFGHRYRDRTAARRGCRSGYRGT